MPTSTLYLYYHANPIIPNNLSSPSLLPYQVSNRNAPLHYSLTVSSTVHLCFFTILYSYPLNLIKSLTETLLSITVLSSTVHLCFFTILYSYPLNLIKSLTETLLSSYLLQYTFASLPYCTPFPYIFIQQHSTLLVTFLSN